LKILHTFAHISFYIFNSLLKAKLALTNDGDEDEDINISFPRERTEVLYGIENAMSRLTQTMSRVRNRADVCGDSLSPSFSMGVEPIKKGYVDFKQRGVKIRFITEITKDNIHYCKELMKFVEELRHMMQTVILPFLMVMHISYGALQFPNTN
jgi:hypothetical protein